MSPTPTRDLDRIAIGTGAASGIGRATTIRLLAEGASVIACDIDCDGLTETRALAPDSDRIVTEVADISETDDVDRAVDHAMSTFGRIDLLANVAGVMENMLPAHEFDDRTWERVMKVNVDGPMRLSRAVLPHHVSQGHGTIVNIGSEAALRGGAAGVACTTSKHASSNRAAPSPGSTPVRASAATPFSPEGSPRRSPPSPAKWALERLGPVTGLMPGIADPDDIATLISWLARDEARTISGASVTSDGGWAAA